MPKWSECSFQNSTKFHILRNDAVGSEYVMYDEFGVSDMYHLCILVAHDVEYTFPKKSIFRQKIAIWAMQSSHRADVPRMFEKLRWV